MDNRGARLTNAVSSTAISLGLIVFAFGYHTRQLDLLIPSLILVAGGGSGVLLCILTLGQIRTEYISIVLSLYNVAFDSSPIVFYVYVKLYKAFGVTPKQFFLFYSIIPILCILLSLFWPKGIGAPKKAKSSDDSDPDKTLELESVETEQTTDTSSNGSNGDSSQVRLDEIESKTPSEVEIASEEQSQGSELGSKILFDFPFKVQLFTKESIYLCIFHTTFSFWLSTYMGSIQSRLTAISPGPEFVPKIESYSETFGLVLSLAFVASPFIGYSIYKLKLVNSLFVCITLAIVWSAWKFVPSIDLQLVAFVLFAIVRAWYYSIIFNIVTQLFGWTNVGKLWGVYSVIAGISSLGFYGVSWSVVNLWHGSYVFPNIVETIMIVGSLSFAIFVKRRKQAFDSSIGAPGISTSLDLPSPTSCPS
jgi:LAT3 family solute carrier family 43 protein 3